MKKIFAALPIILVTFATSCAGLMANEGEDRISKIEERLNNLEERIATLEDGIYKANVRIDNISKNISNIRIEIERLKIKSAEEEVTSQEGSEEDNMYAEERSINYRDMYNKAFKLYTLKKLHQAIEAFNSFLERFPDNELTDNAYFWKGKCYYELGDLEKAEGIFINLIEKCKNNELPDCNKAPSAYLMLGRIYEMQGDYEKADNIYNSLKEKYPNSEEARSLF